MNLEIDHIGILTDSIENTSIAMKDLGFSIGEIVDDPLQKTKIAFIYKEGSYTIELIEPFPENKSMVKMLSKNGNGVYHLCYKVDDIDKTYDSLIEKGWVALFKPRNAPALNNKKICYFWKKEVGLVEVVNN